MAELKHFEIDGSCGGNQDWMRDPWMKLGGCAALAAVDSCIYLSLHKGMAGLCPDGVSPLTIESYNSFAELMRPYLAPRFRGVNRLSLYTAGFSAYLRERGCTELSMKILPMGTPAAEAEAALRARLEAGYPVPILHLLAKTPAAENYHWHWFLLNGCRESGNGLMVRAVTYGEWEWLRFDDLWNENDPDNGGLILYSESAQELPTDRARTAAAVLCDRTVLPTKVFASVRAEGEYSGCCELPAIAEVPGEINPGKLIAISEKEESGGILVTEYYLAAAGTSCPAGRWLSREELHAVSWVPACRDIADIIYAEMTDAASFKPK